MNELTIRIVRGNPSPDDAAAIEAAFRKIAMDADVASARSQSESEWVLRARLAATHRTGWNSTAWHASLRG